MALILMLHQVCLGKPPSPTIAEALVMETPISPLNRGVFHNTMKNTLVHGSNKAGLGVVGSLLSSVNIIGQSVRLATQANVTMTPPPPPSPQDLEKIMELATKIANSPATFMLGGFNLQREMHKLVIRNFPSEKLYKFIGSTRIFGWDSIKIANIEGIGARPTQKAYNVDFDFINNQPGITTLHELYPIQLHWNLQVQNDETYHSKFISVTIGYGKLAIPNEQEKSSWMDVYQEIGPIKVHLPTTLISHPGTLEIIYEGPDTDGRFKSFTTLVESPLIYYIDPPSPPSSLHKTGSIGEGGKEEDSIMGSFIGIPNDPILQSKQAEESISVGNGQVFDFLWKAMMENKKTVGAIGIATAAIGYIHYKGGFQRAYNWITGKADKSDDIVIAAPASTSGKGMDEEGSALIKAYNKNDKALKMSAINNSVNERILREEDDPLVRAVARGKIQEIESILRNPNFRLGDMCILKCFDIAAMNRNENVLLLFIRRLRPYLAREQKITRVIAEKTIRNGISVNVIRELLGCCYNEEGRVEWIMAHILKNLTMIDVLIYCDGLEIDLKSRWTDVLNLTRQRVDRDSLLFAIDFYTTLKNDGRNKGKINEKMPREGLEKGLIIMNEILKIVPGNRRDPIIVNYLKKRLGGIKGLEQYPSLMNLYYD